MRDAPAIIKPVYISNVIPPTCGVFSFDFESR